MLPECVAVGSVHTITQPRWMVDEARISQQGHSGLSVRSYVKEPSPGRSGYSLDIAVGLWSANWSGIGK